MPRMRGNHHHHRAPGGRHDLTQHTNTHITDNLVITKHQLAQRRPTPADTHQEVIDTPTQNKAQSDPPPQRITRTSYTTPRDSPARRTRAFPDESTTPPTRASLMSQRVLLREPRSGFTLHDMVRSPSMVSHAGGVQHRRSTQRPGFRRDDTTTFASPRNSAAFVAHITPRCSVDPPRLANRAERPDRTLR